MPCTLWRSEWLSRLYRMYSISHNSFRPRIAAGCFRRLYNYRPPYPRVRNMAFSLNLGPAPSMEDFDAVRRELSADFDLGIEDT